MYATPEVLSHINFQLYKFDALHFPARVKFESLFVFYAHETETHY